MIKLGYKLMSEEHGPIDLVRNANRAEQAGFDFAAISDHFFPWIEEQGHSPFAWSVLGALANATRQVGLTTAVTCPIMRYDPAIIAQGTATLGLLSDNRFTLALGAGERLNEHIVGEGWPGRGERHERLSEAVDIIQGLLAGTLTNYRGNFFVLDDARLFDRPHVKPPVVIAAGGARAARIAARKGDGLIATKPRADLVEAFNSTGGSGPRYAEVSMCYGKQEEEAQQTASLFPLVDYRLAGHGGTARHRQLRVGHQTCVSRKGSSKGELWAISGTPSAGDRSLHPGRLRPHHSDPDRPGSGRVRRILRAGAGTQFAKSALASAQIQTEHSLRESLIKIFTV
jgi:G6PDH family F420-dependent oxidoreductase